MSVILIPTEVCTEGSEYQSHADLIARPFQNPTDVCDLNTVLVCYSDPLCILTKYFDTKLLFVFCLPHRYLIEACRWKLFLFFQVIGIFAAFGLLLLLASPCLLVAAPCLLCCGYKACKNGGETTDKQADAQEMSPNYEWTKPDRFIRLRWFCLCFKMHLLRLVCCKLFTWL